MPGGRRRPPPIQATRAAPRLDAIAGYLPVAMCLAVAGVLSGCAAVARIVATGQGMSVSAGDRARPIERRVFRSYMGDRWIGNAIAYGPYRDGQAPGGPDPSRDELLEDLRLMAPRWPLIRVYGATGPAADILSVIRAHRLPMRVMLGVWLAPEDRRDSTGAVLEVFPDVRERNRRQVEVAIRLARTYQDIVLAISAGNETQVFWSDHRLPAEQLIRDIRALRAGTRQPVTTADDYNFWNRPESHAVAAEIDFITMHAHPLWNGKSLEEALDWTVATYASIRAAHPGITVVFGETGWATRRHDQGEQARLMKGAADEPAQRVFYDAISAWARATRTTTFFFEAFDENWKGGSHPDEVEKHWGLFRADRTPKAALEAAR